MLACVCRAVPVREVNRAIESGARSVQQLAACTGAGTGCGICVDDLRQRIRTAYRREAPPDEASIAAK